VTISSPPWLMPGVTGAWQFPFALGKVAGPSRSGPMPKKAAMHLDVIDLRQFYYRTRLGRIAQKAIRDQMLSFWPEAKGQTVVGFGFAVPLLRPYLADARRVVGLMPAEQGVMPWPSGPRQRVGAVPRGALAAGDGPCRQAGVPARAGDLGAPRGRAAGMLPRAGPGGRALFIVPNRGGMWARRDKTPFGFGRPYTLGQLEAQLKRHDFVPERHWRRCSRRRRTNGSG
jgi:hypothetical protein